MIDPVTSSPRAHPLIVRVVAAVAAIALVGPLLAVASIASTAEPASAGVTMTLTRDEQSALARLNDYRVARGLSRLQIDPVTQLRARAWSVSMASQRRLSHSPNSSADCRAASPSCVRWAENVGYSSNGEASVFSGFLGSSGHAGNMRRTDVDRVGVGVYTDAGGTTWVTQRFIACSCTNDETAIAANATRDADRSFANALSVDFLARSASAAEMSAAADLLAYQMPTDRIVAGFAGSQEWVGRLIDGYYLSTLGRPADAAGRDHWIAVYRSGRTPASIAASFYGSTEFFNRSGATNRGWVDALYREVLGRSTDASGLAHWSGQADRGVSRSSIATAFYQSPESRQTRVTHLYQALLGRSPDSGGLANWSNRLADGRDVQLAVDLAAGVEYRTRATLRYG